MQYEDETPMPAAQYSLVCEHAKKRKKTVAWTVVIDDNTCSGWVFAASFRWYVLAIVLAEELKPT
jgi:hypothetical protein